MIHNWGTNIERFNLYMEQTVATGDNVQLAYLLDNASCHKRVAEAMILGHRGVRHLLAYSPFFKICENAFLVWKSQLKRELAEVHPLLVQQPHEEQLAKKKFIEIKQTDYSFIIRSRIPQSLGLKQPQKLSNAGPPEQSRVLLLSRGKQIKQVHEWQRQSHTQCNGWQGDSSIGSFNPEMCCKLRTPSASVPHVEDAIPVDGAHIMQL